MKTVKNISAILISAMMLLTTLLQYHHHDDDGNIFIPLTKIFEIEIGHHHGISECHHCHSHQHDSNSQSHQCGLHFSDFDFNNSVDNNFSQIQQNTFDLPQSYVFVPNLEVSLSNYEAYKDNEYSPPLLNFPNSFRAPPFFV